MAQWKKCLPFNSENQSADPSTHMKTRFKWKPGQEADSAFLGKLAGLASHGVNETLLQLNKTKNNQRHPVNLWPLHTPAPHTQARLADVRAFSTTFIPGDISLECS